MEDVTGKKYSRLTAIKFEGRNVKSQQLWEFECDCGSIKTITLSSVKTGNTRSCGCLKSESKPAKTHGKSKTREYGNWADMFKRCYNPKNKDYPNYSSRGIKVDPVFKSFVVFMEEVGDKPDDGQRWSVGRIDNNLSYQPGNVRWENNSTQARNHSLQSNNKTGMAGVLLRKPRKNSSESYVASYRGIDGKRFSKMFSTDKYGKEIALEMAKAYRKAGMDQLETQGANYSSTHGMPKELINAG